MSTPKQVDTDKTLLLPFSLRDHKKVKDAFDSLVSAGWKFYVTNQKRGWCKYIDKTITVPAWTYEERSGKGYWLYYLCHEMAHAFAGYKV